MRNQTGSRGIRYTARPRRPLRPPIVSLTTRVSFPDCALLAQPLLRFFAVYTAVCAAFYITAEEETKLSHATVTWYGHSCFLIELAGSRIVLDPYACGSVPGLRLPDLTADAVHVSHGHSDHNAAECVLRTGRPLRFTAREVAGSHDHHDGAHRGENRILIIEGDGLRLVHLGDQGCPLTQAQIDEIGRPDLLMLPVGGHFTMNAAEARRTMEALQANVVVPMHYRQGGMGCDVLSTLDAFLEGETPVVRAQEQSLTITGDMPHQILIPQLVQ